jgi:hypothetical protein
MQAGTRHRLRTKNRSEDSPGLRQAMLTRSVNFVPSITTQLRSAAQQRLNQILFPRADVLAGCDTIGLMITVDRPSRAATYSMWKSVARGRLEPQRRCMGRRARRDPRLRPLVTSL